LTLSVTELDLEVLDSVITHYKTTQ